ILQELAIDAFEPGDLAVLGSDERAPIMDGRCHLPAIARGIGEGVGELRAIDQQLLRHATANDASAADAAILADGDARAIAAGAPRRGDAARARADGEHVEIVLRHWVS